MTVVMFYAFPLVSTASHQTQEGFTSLYLVIKYTNEGTHLDIFWGALHSESEEKPRIRHVFI